MLLIFLSKKSKFYSASSMRLDFSTKSWIIFSKLRTSLNIGKLRILFSSLNLYSFFSWLSYLRKIYLLWWWKSFPWQMSSMIKRKDYFTNPFCSKWVINIWNNCSFIFSSSLFFNSSFWSIFACTIFFPFLSKFSQASLLVL